MLLLAGSFALGAPDSRPALHLILFEDYPYQPASGKPSEVYASVDLPSARFPEEFSRLFVPFRRRPRFELPPGVSIPRKVIPLDIHTFYFSTKTSQRYQNRFIKFSCEARLRAWTEQHYRLELKGQYRGFKLKNVEIKGMRDRSTLLTVPRTARQTLFAVFTPVPAIPLFTLPAADRSPPPHILKQSLPVLPQGVNGGRGRVLISGLVNERGELSAERLVLLESPHPALARSALESVLNHPGFEPGTRDGKPVETLTTIEVHFQEPRRRSP